MTAVALHQNLHKCYTTDIDSPCYNLQHNSSLGYNLLVQTSSQKPCRITHGHRAVPQHHTLGMSLIMLTSKRTTLIYIIQLTSTKSTQLSAGLYA